MKEESQIDSSRVRDLWKYPVWQAAQLGQPIPASTHAVSVALPRWRDVVGYEEKKAEVMTRLSSGYPRFVVHPLVQELGQAIGDGKPSLPFPSARAAELCAAFARRTSGEEATVTARNGVSAVAASGAGNVALRSFWQHTGLIVSSREAEARL